MKPRQIRPGTTYFITVRVVRRMFLLRPDPGLPGDLEYILAHAANEYGIQVHEYLFHVNHFHLLVTDPRGVLPLFMGMLDSLLSRHINALYGESGKMFEPYHAKEMLDGEAAFDRAVYTLANVVKDGLVTRTSQWRGASSRRMRYGEGKTLIRPRRGIWSASAERKTLRERLRRKPREPVRATHRGKPSQMPESVVFQLERPPARPARTDAELRSAVLAGLHQAEQDYALKRSAAGQRVIGMEEVLRRSRHEVAERPEDLMAAKTVVAGARELVEQRVKELRVFVRAYAAARLAFLSGLRDVVWPEGTWLMRARFGLPCAVSPPA